MKLSAETRSRSVQLLALFLALAALVACAILAVPTRPAHAADLTLAPFAGKAPTASQAPLFLVWGLEVGGTLERRDFNLDAGTASIDIGGARVGGIFGPEFRNQWIMIRVLGELEYDFARGGQSCMTAAGMTRCDVAGALVTTERVDIGIPLGFLGGLTPFVSAGATQDQLQASVGPATARQFENGFLVGAGASVPIGDKLSLFARWDRIGARQALGVGAPASAVLSSIAAVVGAQHDDAVKFGFTGRF